MRGRAMWVGLAVAVSVGGVVAAAITSIDEPATMSDVADRVVPSRAVIGECAIFPEDNPWNQRIDDAPLRADSDEIIARIQSTRGVLLHPDFGENFNYGIPYTIVGADQPEVPITYQAFGDESDPGPFPIPLDAPIEGGADSTGDRHVIVIRPETCELFELYRAFPTADGWLADSGARFDLTTNDLRPLGWTSADAAGLPILPGLVRYEEAARGAINHAIRVTMSPTQRGYILPATHFASNSLDPTLPAMGMRLRLKASFDVDSLWGQSKVIATAMQQYGLIVADNGSKWFFQGAPSLYWEDGDLNQLKQIRGEWFEVVDTGPIRR